MFIEISKTSYSNYEQTTHILNAAQILRIEPANERYTRTWITMTNGDTIGTAHSMDDLRTLLDVRKIVK